MDVVSYVIFFRPISNSLGCKHTVVWGKRGDDSRLEERQSLLLHSANDILCSRLLHLGSLRCHIKRKVRHSRVYLPRHTAFLAALVHTEEDKRRVRLARVEALDNILLRLIEEVLRNELAQFIVFGIVWLGWGASQRSEVVQQNELSRRVLQSR